MKIKAGLLVFAVIIFLCQACQKELDGSIPVAPPIPPKPDTLTAGWSKVVLPGETKISDIFFSSASTGFLTGSKIYKSIDGGNTWITAFSTPGFFNIYMQDDSRALFVESDVWKTLDGGISFNPGLDISLAQDVFILDNVFSYATSYNGFYQTFNGGPWRRILTIGLSTGGGYSSLFFINSSTGWVVSASGIYKVIFNVTSWQKATVTGGSGAAFGSIYATSATNVYVANYQGQIYKSTNSGVSFSLLKQLDATGFMDLHFIDDLNGYASIDRFVFKTADGGLNWNKVVTVGQGAIHEIHFTDASHGWACADGGAVYIFKQ